MKSLSNLLRSKPAIDCAYRRTYGNANMAKRKDLRRLKRINIHNKQISGQSNSNPWFNGKRLKALANTVQGIRNNHEGTNPIPAEVQKQILEKLAPISEYQYYFFRNRETQAIQYKQLVDSCNIDDFISQMPAKLRKDVENAQQNQSPELFEPLLKYIQQIQYYLPKEQRQRYNLLQKIRYPPKAKLEEEFKF